MLSSLLRTTQWLEQFPAYDLLDLIRYTVCTVFSQMLLGEAVVTNKGAVASRGEAISETD